MRHKFSVLTVKKLLKLVSIDGSYRKNKTGVPFFFGTPCIPRIIWRGQRSYSEATFL